MIKEPSMEKEIPILVERERLRKRVLAKRNCISLEERRRWSQEITANFLKLPEFQRGENFFFYVNFRSEVETINLINICLGRGKKVAVPCTDPECHRLIPCQVFDLAQELRPGYCGIPEPDPAVGLRIPPEQIEIVILPGAAFDTQGGRLGYGGGYYDRFLARLAPQALRVGLAFEMQLVPVIPLCSHDQKLDLLVTEKRIIKLEKE